MAKAYGLLDETTIINFRLMFKLMSRYVLHLILSLVFFAGLISYFYFKQTVIYSVSIPVKVADRPSISSDMSSLLLPAISSNSISLSEINATINSYTFLKDFAELIRADNEFTIINFGSIKNEKSIYGSEFLALCKNDNLCVIEKLASSLDGSFSIEKGLTENRFILIVNALDKKTVQKMTNIIIKAIDRNRVHVRQYMVTKEIQNISKLIVESRSLLQGVDGVNTLEDQAKLENNIADLKENVRLIQVSINNEMGNENTLEAQVDENKKSTKGQFGKGSVKYENIVRSKNKLFEIRQNILALSSIPEKVRSKSDEIILKELQNEQIRLSEIIPQENHVKSIESSEAFKESQISKTSEFAFEHVISKKKLAKMQIEYDNVKARLNEMVQEKLNNESKVTGLKSDLEFLKNLESKQMSLKILNATMTSDFIFEEFSRETREFRNSSFVKIVLFSFFITSFLCFISILIRYSLDDTIYGEEEILCHFDSLDFIGEVPIFE